MSSGIPLTDSDRIEWLLLLAKMIKIWRKQGQRVILGCSALKKEYRKILFGFESSLIPSSIFHTNSISSSPSSSSSSPHINYLIYLGVSHHILIQRLEQRQGHYMKSSMLQSQLTSFEPPSIEECHFLNTYFIHININNETHNSPIELAANIFKQIQSEQYNNTGEVNDRPTPAKTSSTTSFPFTSMISQPVTVPSPDHFSHQHDTHNSHEQTIQEDQNENEENEVNASLLAPSKTNQTKRNYEPKSFIHSIAASSIIQYLRIYSLHIFGFLLIIFIMRFSYTWIGGFYATPTSCSPPVPVSLPLTLPQLVAVASLMDSNLVEKNYKLKAENARALAINSSSQVAKQCFPNRRSSNPNEFFPSSSSCSCTIDITYHVNFPELPLVSPPDYTDIPYTYIKNRENQQRKSQSILTLSHHVPYSLYIPSHKFSLLRAFQSSSCARNPLSNLISYSSCVERHRPPVLLISFPSSGNSFTRAMLESLTGYLSGEVYPLNTAKANNNTFDENHHIFVLTNHYTELNKKYKDIQFQENYDTSARHNQPLSHIFLVRNPFDALFSYFYFVESYSNKNTSLISDEELHADMERNITKWMDDWLEHTSFFVWGYRFHSQCNNSNIRRSMIRYEDITHKHTYPIIQPEQNLLESASSSHTLQSSPTPLSSLWHWLNDSTTFSDTLPLLHDKSRLYCTNEIFIQKRRQNSVLVDKLQYRGKNTRPKHPSFAFNLCTPQFQHDLISKAHDILCYLEYDDFPLFDGLLDCSPATFTNYSAQIRSLIQSSALPLDFDISSPLSFSQLIEYEIPSYSTPHRTFRRDFQTFFKFENEKLKKNK